MQLFFLVSGLLTFVVEYSNFVDRIGYDYIQSIPDEVAFLTGYL